MGKELLKRDMALIDISELFEVNGGGFLSIFTKGLEIVGYIEAIYEFGKGFIDGFKNGIKVN